MTEQEAKECLAHLEWLAEDIQKHLSIGYLADLDLCREALEKQIKYQWHNLVENPTDTPDKYNCDWVLVQIVEDNGYVWLPKVAEYRASKQDWLYGEYWLSDYGGGFKVVAWCELPTNDWSDSNDF